MPAAEPRDLADDVLEHLRQAIALWLWSTGAVRVRPQDPFRLASGAQSPIYVNCRRVISEPAFLRLYAAAAGFLLERRGVRFDAVAGGETAGIPYATHLAAALSKPMVYVRKAAKGHGMGRRVEGHLEAGARVLLVEDLITDGGSKLGFLDALAEAGARVTDALVLFDRQQGGAELLAERGVTLHALADLATTLDAGQTAGRLATAERREVDRYLEDPEGWEPGRGGSESDP